MKKTLNIDDKLLRDARVAAGASTDTETVRLRWFVTRPTNVSVPDG